jgi:hypothetical protein
LFKLWLRELETPLIPTELYNDALIAAQSPVNSLDIVGRLPVENRLVLNFVISFVQRFLQDEVVEFTKMTAENLGEWQKGLNATCTSVVRWLIAALIFAPNLLRTTSSSLHTVFTNSAYEARFVLNLLQHLDVKDGEGGGPLGLTA